MAAQKQDFAGIALFDRDRGAVGAVQIDRRGGGGDVEGDAVSSWPGRLRAIFSPAWMTGGRGA
jgi:hypothetical protein